MGAVAQKAVRGEVLLDKETVKKFKNVFLSPEGKEVLNVLEDECNVYREHGISSSLELARDEGKRSIFLFILRMVQVKESALEQTTYDETED